MLEFLIKSQHPESYNQMGWQSMSQRMAWLLQRWLRHASHDPFHYFELLRTPLTISDDARLNVLFEGEHYQGERFVSRYVDRSYWAVWKVEQDQKTYFFILSLKHFYQDRPREQYTFPMVDNLHIKIEQRKSLERQLIDLYEQRGVCDAFQCYQAEGSLASNRTTYAQFLESKNQNVALQLSHNALCFQIPMAAVSGYWKSENTFLANQNEDSVMWDQEIYIKAWNFTSQAHKTQFMSKSDVPYINHIGLVAMEVMRALAQYQTEKESVYYPIKNGNLAVVCALLHDTLEDTEITYQQVSDTFGEQVANGVLALTKDETLPTKREQMLDSLERLKLQPIEVRMVKLADRITNLQAPPAHWTKEKIHYYREEATLILEALGRSNEYLAKRLEAKIQNYQRYL